MNWKITKLTEQPWFTFCPQTNTLNQDQFTVSSALCLWHFVLVERFPRVYWLILKGLCVLTSVFHPSPACLQPCHILPVRACRSKTCMWTGGPAWRCWRPIWWRRVGWRRRRLYGSLTREPASCARRNACWKWKPPSQVKAPTLTFNYLVVSGTVFPSNWDHVTSGKVGQRRPVYGGALWKDPPCLRCSRLFLQLPSLTCGLA